jgi:hypothetical protein
MNGDLGPQARVKLLGLMFVVGTVLGLLAVVLWVGLTDDDSGDETALQSSSSRVADQPEPQGSTRSEPAAPADSRGDRCADAAEALTSPLEAARPALRQWDVHVAAMNQLVRGEISLQQATEFWERTRLGAQRKVERFRTAWDELQRTGVDCPAPAFLGSAPATVRSCSRLAAARLGVLETAKTSIDTWDTHVHHMDMLRMGTMTPQQATDMWLTMWRRGVRDLDAYRTATRSPALELECAQG